MTNDSYFTDESMMRRIHRERIVGLFGPRALLMQATHPVAFAGFFAHTGALEDPYERLNRTARMMDTIAFGSKATADSGTKMVRTIHRKVRGRLLEPTGRYPAGTPYAADDPVLLLWVLATLVDSALLVYQRYVGSLTRDQRNSFWMDYRVVGRLFGLKASQMPREIEEFDAYMEAMLTGDDLYVDGAARKLAVGVVMKPPVDLYLRPLLEYANFATVGLLPARIRELYGFSWDPARGLSVRGGAEYLKRAGVPFLPGRLRYVPSARAA